MAFRPSLRALGVGLCLTACAAERAPSRETVPPASGEPAAPAAPPQPPRVAGPPEAPATARADEWPSAERLALGFPRREPGARIYSKARVTFIRQRPGQVDGYWLGFLGLGDSARLKDGDPAKAHAGKGYSATCHDWYAIEPQGYVCTGRDATIDANDPEVIELARTRANVESPWPYRYAESLGAPVLPRLPALPADAKPGSTPSFLPGPTSRAVLKEIVPGSMVAYTDTFEYGAKSYLMTWDRGFMDLSRVKPFPESSFHGVALGGDVQLPIAFVREDEGGEMMRRLDDGTFASSNERLPRLSWIPLTEKSERVGKEWFHETRRGTWVRGSQVAVARRQKAVPYQAQSSFGRKTWVDISIWGGTLVAYEDATPVYATLMSPGRGGPPVPGKPTLDTASTPTGVFQVLGKYTTTTMVSSTIETFIHSEVQYTQGFDGPYALHAAYWHDRWGKPKSAGCVNLSPIDARRLFAWTDPPMPEGWHGISSAPYQKRRTILSIRD